MVIRELLIKLGLNGGAQVNRELDRVDSGVNKTMQSFNALGGVIAGVFGALTISNIAKTADEMQSLEARIGMLPQTVTDGADAFDTVAKRASSARQGIEEYASFYIKAGNATQDFYKSQEQVLDLTDAVSIALAASGSTAVAQGQAFFQLGQAIGSPTVQMEEMNTLIDVAPDLFRALGKAIPGADNNLKAFISTGKVTGRMLAEGLIKVLPQFVDQFKKMPMTIGQALVLVNNRWSMFINRLNRSSGAVTWVADKFLWLADKVEHSLDIVVDALGGAENAVKLLGVALGAAGLVAGVWALSAAFTALTSPITLVIGSLALLYLVFNDISNWYQGNKSIFGDIFGPISEHKDDVKQMQTAMSDLLVIVNALKNAIVALNGALNDLPGADFVQGIGDKLGTTSIGPAFRRKMIQSNDYAEVNDDGSVDWSKTLANFVSGTHSKLSGVRDFNSEAEMNAKIFSNLQSSVPPSAVGNRTVSVTIGNITVPAGTTEQQQAFLRDSAQKTFNEVGWSKMADNMNFNTGG
ncbi:tape measure protein [Serratia ficaria]|uniref:tape measure protein n=1 Tax=Serratia ficaria TaxID=61651 RepID=UPI00217BCD90|nr:tape measure protein [Serratia ficaria]CAI1141456.1 Phage-related minor tail protein [Serratia ficaria]CAI2016492.1 Phage-related minor tail protein [Serratia ficaria]